jgi:hypothetical protein
VVQDRWQDVGTVKRFVSRRDTLKIGKVKSSFCFFSFDANTTVPDVEEYVMWGAEYEKLFERYSGFDDGEADEIFDFSAEIDEAEAEDEEMELEAVLQASESDGSDENVEECQALVPSDFARLPNNEKYKKMSLQFSPELIQGLMEAYQKRFRQVGKMNLPFWSLSNELTRSHLTNAPLYRSLSLNNFSINGKQIARDSSTSMTNSLQLPPKVLRAMGNSKNFRLKIFERSYDISIDEGANNQLMQFGQAQQQTKFAQTLHKGTVGHFTGDSNESETEIQTKQAS